MMGDIVARLLEEELSRQGIAFRFDADSGCYVIERDGGTLSMALDNLRRGYEQDQDASRVARLVETALQATRPLGGWAEERSAVTFCLEASDYTTPPPLRTRISDDVDRVPVHSDTSRGAIIWLDQAQLDKWQVSLEELTAEAFANLARALTEAKLEYFESQGVRIGYFVTSLRFKTALLLAPNLKEVVEPVLGWPLLAVLPHRDFVYLWDAAHEEMIERVGGVVVKEFKAAPYPLTTEVFRISDEGIEAICAFQAD